MADKCSTVSFSEEKQIRGLIDACSSAPLFQDITEQCMKGILQNASVQEFNSGKVLVQQGDVPSYLYLVFEGTVKTLQYNEDGEEAVIRMLKENDTFMEAIIFMGSPSPVSAQIVEKSKLLMIPASSVKAHVMMNNQFARNLLEIVSKHYKKAIQQVTSIVLKSPVERIGHYLLGLHLEQGSELMDITLPFKKSMIAHHLGMQPETFSRALQQIKKSGINIDGEHITMSDSFALCHFCDIDMANSCERRGTEGCSFCDEL